MYIQYSLYLQFGAKNSFWWNVFTKAWGNRYNLIIALKGIKDRKARQTVFSLSFFKNNVCFGIIKDFKMINW